MSHFQQQQLGYSSNEDEGSDEYDQEELGSQQQPSQQTQQQQQQLKVGQKYNLVEKKLRKKRCGKQRGPQEEFIFHLKLEEEKKKKRSSSKSLVNAATTSDSNNKKKAAPTSPDDAGKQSAKKSRKGSYSDTIQQQQQKQHPTFSFPENGPNSAAIRDLLESATYTDAHPFPKLNLNIDEVAASSSSSSGGSIGKSSSSSKTSSPLNATTSSSIIPNLLSTQIDSVYDPSAFNNAKQQQGGAGSAEPPQQRLPVHHFEDHTMHILSGYFYKRIFPTITDVKAIEETYALLQLQQQHTELSMVPTAVLFGDGRLFSANQAFIRMLGFPHAQPQNTTSFSSCSVFMQDLIHPDDRHMHNLLLFQMFAEEGDSFVHEGLSLVAMDTGIVLKSNVETACIRSTQNNTPRALVVRITKSDVTNRLCAEVPQRVHQHLQQKHQQSEVDLVLLQATSCDEHFLTVIERQYKCPQPACFYDGEGIIIWNNDAFDNILGVQGRPFVGIRAFDLPAIKGSSMEFLARYVVRDQPDRFEYQSAPTPIFALGKVVTVRGYGQRLNMNMKNNKAVYGFLWLFSVLEFSDIAVATATGAGNSSSTNNSNSSTPTSPPTSPPPATTPPPTSMMGMPQQQQQQQQQQHPQQQGGSFSNNIDSMLHQALLGSTRLSSSLNSQPPWTTSTTPSALPPLFHAGGQQYYHHQQQQQLGARAPGGMIPPTTSVPIAATPPHQFSTAPSPTLMIESQNNGGGGGGSGSSVDNNSMVMPLPSSRSPRNSSNVSSSRGTSNNR